MWDPDVKLAIAQPLTWPYIHKDTHVTMLTMERPSFTYLNTPRGGGIAEKRDAMAEEALRLGMDYIFFMDADMVYPFKVLEDLFSVIKEGADIAGGLCYRGYPPYDPLLWHPTEERLLIPFTDFQFGDIVEAGATGAACLLIDMKIFKELPRPWFQFTIETKNGEDGKEVAIRQGEDVYFTRKATRAGYKLHIWTEYDIGHIREVAVNRDFWLSFAVMNKVVATFGWGGVKALLEGLDKGTIKL